MVPEISGTVRSDRRDRCHDLLSTVDLDPASFAHRYPHQLSGGQRQRVGLARALAGEPPILLMDEPFGALDPLTRAEMQDMVRDLLERFRKTALLITHNLDEALFLASRIVLLANGKLVAGVNASDFLTSDHPEVQEYVRAFRRGERESLHIEEGEQ
jgi:osmoprotectant transport system ATP-binding protein